ncbi:ArsR/SmtB family transcription factor [Peribacillus kribbensis]|uniref:ArsR/SmtB family transcription factor n=1 Tax=Peribacillus kribbensis TaxID=356658 RepID=UPI00041EE396|nr:ArsR family transcriptional regulator [Peribacillus kribbensis]
MIPINRVPEFHGAQFRRTVSNLPRLLTYILQLSRLGITEVKELYKNALTGWETFASRNGSWQKWMDILEFEAKQNKDLDLENPVSVIERITGGIRYIPGPSIWTIKLIPHICYSPWILKLRTKDTFLLFYPVKEEYLLEPGQPAQELVRGHKALSDSLRLKLLYQLTKGPLALQELSVQFNISKTTLHHQLSLLKAAKFVKVDKGIYTADLPKILSFHKSLALFFEKRP